MVLNGTAVTVAFSRPVASVRRADVGQEVNDTGESIMASSSDNTGSSNRELLARRVAATPPRPRRAQCRSSANYHVPHSRRVHRQPPASVGRNLSQKLRWAQQYALWDQALPVMAFASAPPLSIRRVSPRSNSGWNGSQYFHSRTSSSKDTYLACGLVSRN
jgi:hypothetical protein